MVLINTTHTNAGLFTMEDWQLSDQCPVICKLDTIISLVNAVTFDYIHADWKKYGRVIEQSILPDQFASCFEIEDSIELFTSILLEARDHSTPKSLCRDQLNRVAPDTISAIKYKNSLNRQWQRCSDNVTKGRLKPAVNIAGKLVEDLVARDLNVHWKRIIKKIDNDPRKMWRVSRSIRGKRAKIPSALWHNGVKIVSDSEKAESFAKKFEGAHTTTLHSIHPHDAKVHSFTTKFGAGGPYTDFIVITIDELVEAAGTLRPFKAPGNDGIMNIMLKNLPPTGMEFLCNVFNACIRFNYWPQTFKEARVIPIPKAGKDANKSENYRPISLLNTIGKLFEKIIYQRLIRFVEYNDILNEEQFGFRRQHSTSHQILRVSQHIRNKWRQRKSTGMVLFDIEKAFDSVWHDGLVFKVNKMDFPKYLCAMIREFRPNRTFRVFVNDGKSLAKRIPAGLPQGSILSPSLYSIFLSDLKFNKHTDSACYADDTAVYSSANRTKTVCKNLQNSLNRVECFYDKWKIRATALKTQVAEVAPIGSSLTERRSNTDSVKYLGVTLDRKLSFREHITSARNKATRCMAALYPPIGRRSVLSTANKMRLYKAIIRPVMTYASPIWITAAHSDRKQLQVAQNKCLKLIHKLPRRLSTTELHELANITTVRNL